jgi:hypothetical protein
MVLSRYRVFIVAAALVASGVVSVMLAQPAQGRGQGAPMYDRKTEATFSGTVEAVVNITHPERIGRRALGGTHLTLKTTGETIEVHLGPTAFVADQKISISKGDRVEILGSRITLDGEAILLAREIKAGNNAWTLREASGRPLWSRGVQTR